MKDKVNISPNASQLILALCLLFFAAHTFGQPRPCRLLVADTPEKHEKGLMGYRSLVGYDGMLFLYSDRAVRHFWNKNTYLELDIYWLDGERVVGRSYLPSVEAAGIVIVSSPRPVDRVVELLRGRECLYGKAMLSPKLEGGKGKDAK